jgi:PAS domain S-box-containing protein
MKADAATPVAFVINDDRTQLLLLGGLLRKDGIEVHSFSGAEAALAALEQHGAPDLIVTDLFMPGIDGWRFCRLLRSADYPACNHIPILVVSATYAGEEAGRITADLGANGFLPSPVEGSRFLAMVRSLLAGEQARQLLRVLIVEDSPSQAKLLWDSFISHDYLADIAQTMAEAVEAFGAFPYDLAILDYSLPDGNGGQLLSRLQEMQPQCVFLMITAESTPGLALDLMKKGAAAFLRKPFEPAYLIEIAIRARKERTLLRVEDLLEARTRQLRRSEEWFRSIAQNAFDLVSLLDEQGHYLFCNDAYRTILGYDPEELVGRSCFDLVSPKDRDHALQLYRQTLATNKPPAPFTLRILHRQGRELTVHYQARVLEDFQKNSGGRSVLLNGRDITQQQLVELALFRRASLLEALAESATVLLMEKELPRALNRVVEAIGQASGQDRTYIFTISLDPNNGNALATMRHEWVRPGVSREINNPLMHNFPMSRHMPTLFEQLSAGLVIGSRVGDLPADERLVFDDQHILSILLVPISVDGVLWGFIGFDNCRTEYDWAEGEQSALISLALSINSAVQRSKAEQELRLAHDRTTAAFAGIDASIHVADAATRVIVYANENCRRIFGDDILGRRCWEVFQNATESCSFCPCDQLTRESQSSTATEETDLFSAVNGRWYDCRTKLIAWEGGRPALMRIATDITERKQAEMALIAGKEEYQRLFGMLRLMADTMPDMLWAKNVNREYLFANQALCRDLLNAKDTAEPLGKTDVFFAEREQQNHPDDPCWHTFGELCMDSDAATLQSMRQMQFDEFGNVRGKYLHLDVHKAPLFDQRGELIGVVGSARDITERKQAEAERERLVLAIEQTSETIVITDTTGAIVYANPSFERITGYSREEALGLNPRILKSGKHEESFYSEMWKTLRRGEVWSGRIVNRKKDGTLFTEEAVISPVRDGSGTTVSYVAVKRDISENIRLEEQLRQAQKMESIGQLAGGVAHDFNNMLGVILGQLEMAMRKMEPAHPAWHHLNDIRQAAERSTELTRQLLTFARKQAIAPKVLDLNEAIAGMLKILQRLIGEGIELIWRPGSYVWPVLIDPTQVDQILANLCVNARDAMDGAGTITITTGNFTVNESNQCGFESLEPGDGYVQLSVSDNGSGMDQETIAHIFEPFFTTKEAGVGTGLGLATVYGIVRQNKGQIDVRSTPGQGSTFSVVFPKAPDETGGDTASTRGISFEYGHETILLVEDELLILTMTENMLEMLGYTVLAAQTPGEALQQCKNYPGPIDLLLSDVIMPEMSGLDLAQRMLSIRPHLKCLFMSGYTADVINQHGSWGETIELINKPFMLHTLAAKVRGILDRP